MGLELADQIGTENVAMFMKLQTPAAKCAMFLVFCLTGCCCGCFCCCIFCCGFCFGNKKKHFTPTLSVSDIVYAVGMAVERLYKFSCTIGCKKSFHWASEKLSHVWVRLFLENLKIVASKDRTHAESELVSHSANEPTVLMSNWSQRSCPQRESSNCLAWQTRLDTFSIQ